MSRPYGKTPKKQFSSWDSPAEKKPTVVLKIKEPCAPGELSVTLQRGISELERQGLFRASVVSVYITPLDPEGNPVTLKDMDGKPIKEIILPPYSFVAPDLKL